MKFIVPTLKKESQGSEVKNLHYILFFIVQKLNNPHFTPLFNELAFQEVYKTEVFKHTYGAITSRIVGFLQEILQMQNVSRGVVDAVTAEKLNAILQEFGGLTVAKPEGYPFEEAVDNIINAAPRIVSGRVLRADGQAYAGGLVRAFQEIEGMASLIRVGEDVSDAEGHYTIRYDPAPDSKIINLQVNVSDETGKILHTSKLVSNVRVTEVINLSLPALESDAGMHRVDGRIFLEHGLPATNVKLRLYRLGFGGAQGASLLAETTTQEQGLYNLPYTSNGVANNLEVRAVDDTGKEIALSQKVLRAGKQEVMNLVAPSTLQPLAAEYTRLQTDLVPHIGNIHTLGQTQENTDRSDLTLLNEATGWDARLIALAATAVKLTTPQAATSATATALPPEVGLPTDVLYGALRAGLPSDKTKLAQVSPQAFKQGLEKARSVGIVEMSDTQMTQAVTAFEAFRLDTRLSFKTPGSVATYADILKQSSLTADQQKSFAEVYFNHQGDASKLWESAAAKPELKEVIPVLQKQGKLAYLTNNNPEVMSNMQAMVGDNIGQSLVDLKLYNKEVWKGFFNPVPVGQSSVVESEAEDMARKVRISYPTEVTWNMIRTGEMDVSAFGSTSAIALFLKNAIAKGYKLGIMPVDKFVNENPDVWNGIEESKKHTTQEAIKTLHRVYQITPSNDAMKILLAQGLFSSQDVLSYTLEVFLERFGPLLPPNQARLIYRKCEQVNGVTTSLFLLAKELENTPSVSGMSATPEVRQTAKDNLVKTFPTLEGLFGSMDYCECEHCRSVLSPAAYLVDLLQFLDTDGKVWENTLTNWKAKHATAPYPFKNMEAFTLYQQRWQAAHPTEPVPLTERTPYELLMERRPDISNIPLTCENTHTALPQIDLVNEILEYYVAHQALSADAARDTGEASSAELLAEPQYIEPEAYKILLKAQYPLNLPFDLWLETARQFCSYFDTLLWQLMEVFRQSDALFEPTQTYDRAAVFVESLGISPTELAIFTNPTPLSDWFKLYGFDTELQALTPAFDANKQHIDLNSAKALSRRLGVTYKELVDIIKTGFINPQLNAFALLYKLDMGIDDVLFYKNNRTDYEVNADLLDKKRENLTAPEQIRYDALKKEEWNTLQEVHGIVQEFKLLSKKFPDFDALAWLNTALQNNDFDRVLLLEDLSTNTTFDETKLKYANGNKVDGLALLKINLFVRLWRKLGWSIEDTDRALQTFIPKNAPFESAHLSKKPLLTALIYLAHFKSLETQVATGKNNRQKLLTLWTDLPVTGKNPLYAQLFLTRSILRNDPIFDDQLGRYLTKPGLFIKDHLLALQGALGLTASEIDQILTDNGFKFETAALSLPQVSLLYRYVLLAKAVKLSISHLIALKQLTGLNPFALPQADPLSILENDAPFSQTMRFMEIVETVKASGFHVEDLDYLLRHRFDSLGKYRPNDDKSLDIAKSIAIGIRTIQAEHAIPNDPTALSDEALRQKLGLVLPVAVVARLFAMLDNTQDITVVKTGVVTANQLSSEVFRGDSALQKVSYNTIRQEQTLVFRGVLLDAQKTALMTKYSSLEAGQKQTLSDLLDAVQTESKSFFTKYLQKQAVNTTTNSGFLEASDYATLFEPLNNEATIQAKRALLIQAFLPYLQKQLIRQLVIQTMTTVAEADPSVIESLLTDRLLLTDPSQSDQPLLSAFQETAVRGVSATFFADPDMKGTATQLVYSDIDTSLKDAKGKLLRPVNSKSVRFQGYLEVPIAGAYRFYAQLAKKDTKATLQFEHLEKPVFDGIATKDNDTIGKEVGEFVEFKAGISYHFTFNVPNLNDGTISLLVHGEQLPVDSVSRLTLYAETAVQRSVRAQLLLKKSLQLIQTLGLSERELRYLMAHRDNFGKISLNDLPTDTPLESASKQFAWFERLLSYTALRNVMTGGSAELIAVFEAAESKNLDKVYDHIARLTRRDKTIVEAIAKHLFATPNFIDERPLMRLWKGLQAVENFKVPVASLLEWVRIVGKTTTEEERYKIAKGLKEAIKARFEPDNWLRIAQPIFDKLRQYQRDALVTYIVHLKDFERMEQLFEYFLIDPGTEPVVQTSRIRAAISAVQVFIQRCLLNMEPTRVSPTAIDSKQWAWMKRYRVWEANRKIFLYPENWLEPEFRDDKTHLFTELEGALLQGDVSNDLVEDAFFKYLKKLDELARLDIVAMYCEEYAFDPAGSTLHVIGRTFAEPHKYFYRRYKHQMWTIWEPVTAEIQGNHIIPVVWRNRLNLFWVTFMEQADPNGAPATTSDTSESFKITGRATTDSAFLKLKAEKKLTEVSLEDIHKSLRSVVGKKMVTVQLHWSEYFNGEWSARESGGMAASLSKVVNFGFNSESAFIHVNKEYNKEDGEEQAVKIHIGGEINQAFCVVSRNSTPEAVGFEEAPHKPYTTSSIKANRYSGSGSLQVTFNEKIVTKEGEAPQYTPKISNILQEGGTFTLLTCANALSIGKTETKGSDEIGALVAPVFYQDNKGNTFFVEPTFKEKTIEEWQEWVKTRTVTETEQEIPGYLKEIPLAPVRPRPKLPIPIDKGDPIWNPGIDRHARFDMEVEKDWLANPATMIHFNGELIGQTGRAGVQILSNSLANELQAATLFTANPGSEVAGVIVVADNAVQANLSTLNIVGSNGLNQALISSVNESYASQAVKNVKTGFQRR